MKPIRPTIADVARNYAAEKMREEWHGEWGAAFIYRPVAILLTPVFLWFSISASAVTFASAALALTLPVLAASGWTLAYAVVGFLAIVIVTLDCVDGNIARITNTVTSRGHYADFIADVLFRLCCYSSVGLLADHMNASIGWFRGNHFALAAIAAALAIAARLSRVYAEKLIKVEVYARKEAASSRSLSSYAFSLISGLDHLLPFAILVAGSLDALGWIVSWLLLYSTLDFVYTQWSVLKRLA